MSEPAAQQLVDHVRQMVGDHIPAEARERFFAELGSSPVHPATAFFDLRQEGADFRLELCGITPDLKLLVDISAVGSRIETLHIPTSQLVAYAIARAQGDTSLRIYTTTSIVPPGVRVVVAST